VLQLREIRRNFLLISCVSVIDYVPEFYCFITVDLFFIIVLLSSRIT
jgi:hypothetical protein